MKSQLFLRFINKKMCSPTLMTVEHLEIYAQFQALL